MSLLTKALLSLQVILVHFLLSSSSLLDSFLPLDALAFNLFLVLDATLLSCLAIGFDLCISLFLEFQVLRDTSILGFGEPLLTFDPLDLQLRLDVPSHSLETELMGPVNAVLEVDPFLKSAGTQSLNGTVVGEDWLHK